MLKKIGTLIKVGLLIFGIGGIVGGLFSSEIASDNRVFYIILGIMMCVIALIDAVRWLLTSALFFGVGITAITRVLNEGKFDAVMLSVLIFCIAVAIYFGRKTYQQISRKYSRRFTRITMRQVDQMSGLEFEHYTAQLLRRLGYTNVTVTKASGDQGIDVLAQNNGFRYAIQCKNYSGKLGNTPVQEAFAGKAFYECDIAVVATNSTFTEGASKLANSIGVLLWDREVLQEMIRDASKKRTLKPNPKPDIATPLSVPISESVPAAEPITDTSQITVTIPAPTTYPTQCPELSTNYIPHTSTELLLQKITNDPGDIMLPIAVDIILETGQASVSMIQRRLKLGYARAARIVDEMEEKGIVGPFRGSTPREIWITPAQWDLARSCVLFSEDTNIGDQSDVVNQHRREIVDPQFIAEAQWYAARDSIDLPDGE